MLNLFSRLTKGHRIRSRRKDRLQPLVFESLEPRRFLSVSVPEFSSLPGADQTIFLDFDGHAVEGTSWNSYYNQSTLNAPAYNIDGNSTSFSTTELARIEESWNRIAEDFRPFDVNVTTVDPGVDALQKNGAGDSQWGVRVLITNEANMVTDPAQRTGAGGIAYINSFNWSTDTPVWVFTTGGKSIAEAGSHEVGHSLGLSHDGLISGSSYYTGHGSGETGWASIMGVGYYENVSQWDNGEYYNSNNGGSGANYGRGADDLAVIVGNNGFGYRADDHGNTDAASSLLSVSGTTVLESGLIETTGDVDVFSFTTGSGLVTLDIDPFNPGTNLDVKAELYDGAGGLVATSDSSSALAAGFSLNLTAGQYFLHVDGTGWGTPGASSPSGYSDYASLGNYVISGSVVDTGGLPTISINDVSAGENSGPLTFEISLSAPSDGNVSVNFQTLDETANAGSDYVGANGTVSFLTGEQTKSVTINLISDDTFENTQTMLVNLFSASGAVIVDNQGVGSIIDDDQAPMPTLSISDASAQEGKFYTKGKNKNTAQLTNMQFTVTLSSASSQAITVDYATADSTATTADNDYQLATGTVTFNAGETSKTISVTIVGDNLPEGDETFEVNLASPSNATILDGTGIGTIVGDDAGGGGGGGGGGNGNGRGGKKIPSGQSQIMIADPIWFFEAVDVNHDHANDTDQMANQPAEPEFVSPFAGMNFSAEVSSSPGFMTAESPLQLFASEEGLRNDELVLEDVSSDLATYSDSINDRRFDNIRSSESDTVSEFSDSDSEFSLRDEVFGSMAGDLVQATI